jgi:hypothetical protein
VYGASRRNESLSIFGKLKERSNWEKRYQTQSARIYGLCKSRNGYDYDPRPKNNQNAFIRE